jgi:hypothetical protein
MSVQERFREEFPGVDVGDIRPVEGTLDEALKGHQGADVFMLTEDPSGFVVRHEGGTVFVPISAQGPEESPVAS